MTNFVAFDEIPIVAYSEPGAVRRLEASILANILEIIRIVASIKRSDSLATGWAARPVWSKNPSEPISISKHRFDSHHRSTQRGPPQRPVYTPQAPCPSPSWCGTVPSGVWDFLTIRDIGCPNAGSETTVCSLLHRKDHAMSALTTELARLKLTAAQKPTQIPPVQQRCNKLRAGFET